MAYFTGKDYRIGARDYRMFLTNPIAMFMNTEVLEKELEWYERQKYQIVRLDCDTWENLYHQLSAFVSFAEWDERDSEQEEFFAYNVRLPAEGGLVFNLKGFERLDALDRDRAESFLQIFAQAALERAMIGERMLALLQTENKDLSYQLARPPLIFWHFGEGPRPNPGQGGFSVANATMQDVEEFLSDRKK